MLMVISSLSIPKKTSGSIGKVSSVLFCFLSSLLDEYFSLVYVLEVLLSEKASVYFYVYLFCLSSLNCYMPIFLLMICCNTEVQGKKQQQEIQHNFTGLFHRNMLTFIYGFFLLMTILLIAD